MYLGTEFSNFVCWPFVAGPGNWGLDPVDVSFDSDHDPASPPRDLRGDGQCCDITGTCAWANLWRFADLLCLMADDFWLVLPVILLVWSLGEATIRVKAQTTTDRFDFLGLLLLGLGLFSLIEVLDQFTASGLTAGFWGYVAALAVAIVGMSYHLKHTTTPLLNFSLFKQAGIRARAINFFILQFSNIGIAFVIQFSPKTSCIPMLLWPD